VTLVWIFIAYSDSVNACTEFVSYVELLYLRPCAVIIWFMGQSGVWMDRRWICYVWML